MAIFPIIIDSKPEYLGGSPTLSLLQLPCGNGTLLSYFAERLVGYTPYPLTIVRNFDAPTAAYDDLMRALGGTVEASVPTSEFQSRLTGFEPSDWLLLVEPRCFPLEGFDPSPLFGEANEKSRLVRHLIALEASTAGTNERVELDARGLPRRVQRYYDSVTWTITKGVACSLVSVSSLTMSQSLESGSLLDLRRSLAARGVPAQDFPIAGRVVDLANEQGLLALNERLLKDMPFDRHATRLTGNVRVHSTARIVGPVVLQPGADIGENVVVIGPAVIGVDARLEPGSIVAQCVIVQNTVVPADAVVRHRVVTTSNSGLAPHGIVPDDHADGGHFDLSEETVAPSLYPTVKWAVESAVALIALVLLSPLLLLVAVLVKMDSKGPVFYRDPREGKDGRLFHCYKFRTMIVGAHAAQRTLSSANQVDGPQFKMDIDPRVTRLGRWLRLANIDELPQLFNVLRAEMSLVGPRPSPFRENQTCVPWREARLSVRPGITGLWQVCRHEREAGDFHQWIYYDIQYVRHLSAWVDLKIIAGTALVTVGARSHLPLSWIISPAPHH